MAELKLMLKGFKPDMQSLSALIMAISIYGIAIFGTSDVAQAVVYLVYLFGLGGLCYFKVPLKISMQFSITLLIFLSLWITPTLINYYSGSLESEAIRLPVLAYHSIVLTAVLLWLYLWQKNNKPYDFLNFAKYLAKLIIPLLIVGFFIIFLKKYILQPQDIQHKGDLIFAFVYRHLDAELFLIGCFFVYFLESRLIKFILYLVFFVALTMMEVRGGMLAFLGFIGIAEILPFFKGRLKQYWPHLIFFIFVSFFLWDFIYAFIDHIFLLHERYRGLDSGFTGRISQWREAWSEIQTKPLLGYGYYVKLFPFNDPTNPSTHIHNFILRIWYENGGMVILSIIVLLFYTAIKIECNKFQWERGVFWAILFYYFFVPRHIQLNPCSIILYLIIIKSCLAKGIEKKGVN